MSNTVSPGKLGPQIWHLKQNFKLITCNKVLIPERILGSMRSIVTVELCVIYDITRCHIMSFEVTWCHLRSHNVTWCHLRSHGITRCQIKSCHLMSQAVTWYHKMSYEVTWCHMMPQDVKRCHIWLLSLALLLGSECRFEQCWRWSYLLYCVSMYPLLSHNSLSCVWYD